MSDLIRIHHSYVGGELVPGGPPVPVENPATQSCCGEFTPYTAAIIDQALASAHEAFGPWSRLPTSERLAHLRRLREAIVDRRAELIACLIAETGKPLDNAAYDYGMLPDCLDFFSAEVARWHGETLPDPDGVRTHRLVRHPLGVVVGLLAWNFPLLNLAYKLAPILATGCTCILKPSSLTPLATAMVGEICHDIGFPPGVINLVLGSDRELGRRLLTSDIPAVVTMIGSTAAGCQVMADAATSVKRFSLELGGNAPVIVAPDYDPAEAARQVMGLKLANTGQVCVSPNRCFVPFQQFDAFLAAAVAEAERYHLGAGDGPGPRLGPCSSAAHLTELTSRLEAALAAGAELVCGGRRPAGEAYQRGHWLEPTVVRCERDLPLCRDEIFGPILPVIGYHPGDDDVVEWANDTPAGLASYLFTHRVELVEEAVARLTFGSICVNEPYYAVHLPHGGMKQSGVGKDCSHLALDEYVAIKRVTVRTG